MIEKVQGGGLVKGTWVSLYETRKLAGTYRGNWGGYIVSFKVNGQEYTIKTDIGIRTPFSPCVVTISEEGEITVAA